MDWIGLLGIKGKIVITNEIRDHFGLRMEVSTVIEANGGAHHEAEDE